MNTTKRKTNISVNKEITKHLTRKSVDTYNFRDIKTMKTYESSKEDLNHSLNKELKQLGFNI